MTISLNLPDWMFESTMMSSLYAFVAWTVLGLLAAYLCSAYDAKSWKWKKLNIKGLVLYSVFFTPFLIVILIIAIVDKITDR